MVLALLSQSAGAGESRGIWISKAELTAVPARGAAWKSLLKAARTPIGKPELYDQKDGTDVLVMARALVWVKTGEARYRDEVLEAIREVIRTPKEPRGKTLSLGRNLIAYVIAADLVGLPPELDERFREYLRSIRTEVDAGPAPNARELSRGSGEQLGHPLRGQPDRGVDLPRGLGRRRARRPRVRRLARRPRGVRRVQVRP